VAHPAFVELCLELLAPLGVVRARRMFGAHGLYADDLFIAIVSGNQLYLKTHADTQASFEAAGGHVFTYEASGRPVTLFFSTPPPEALESPHAMAPWAGLALAAARRTLLQRPARMPGASPPPDPSRGRS
jgi:DNA transformation protein and related proteins